MSLNRPSTAQNGRRSSPLSPLQVNIHSQILHQLDELMTLVAFMREGRPLNESQQALARRSHLFFTTVGIAHHLDEERNVFPGLEAVNDVKMQAAIKALREEHVQLKTLWMRIAPELNAVARGYRWHDMKAFEQSVDAFLKLYSQHMVAEDAVLSPI